MAAPSNPDTRHVSAARVVLVAVTFPHDSLTVDDLTITRHPTPIPADRVQQVQDAAQAAGVRLAEKEQ